MKLLLIMKWNERAVGAFRPTGKPKETNFGRECRQDFIGSLSATGFKELTTNEVYEFEGSPMDILDLKSALPVFSRLFEKCLYSLRMFDMRSELDLTKLNIKTLTDTQTLHEDDE